MQERDIRLLFNAGHWQGAVVVHNPLVAGWQVLLVGANDKVKEEMLSAKRGGPRIFKTSDAAFCWCRSMGFDSVKVQLTDEQNEIEASTQLKYFSVNKKVLLVEDNEDDITLTLRAFKKHKVANDIIVKRDGAEALEYLFGNDPNETDQVKELPCLVLLDINLPKISGLEVLQKIRHSEKTKRLPVVILTTSDEQADVQEGYQLGSNSYILKPVDFSVFTYILEQLGLYWLELNTPPPTQ